MAARPVMKAVDRSLPRLHIRSSLGETFGIIPAIRSSSCGVENDGSELKLAGDYVQNIQHAIWDDGGTAEVVRGTE